ncbi:MULTISPECIES: MauE/DoxX family redox-associated membrane protein [unclassified Rhodococcus (in: high G+C Gram-positive bacteria)]|uniref:MauE/DoxX family redox-associated membrane protein n=1 Tax=unclassified Rhodococcus (in: high G+C Gram-positive bacteria) TaxID=192944 RepID=UPI003390AFF1
MLWAAMSSVVGAVLLVAGVPKVRDRDRMVRAVRGYRLLPESMATAVGNTLPWLEIVLGLALVLVLAPTVTGALAAAMFFVFFAALTINLVRGRRDLDCGCFAFSAGGDEVAHIGWWHAARAGSFALLAAVVTFTPALEFGERIAGIGVGLFVVGLVCVGVYARSVMSFGRRPIDDYLTNAAIELRAVKSVSRY